MNPNTRSRGNIDHFPAFTFLFSMIGKDQDDKTSPSTFTVIADGVTVQEAETRAREGLVTTLAEGGWEEAEGHPRLDLRFNGEPIPNITETNIFADVRGYESTLFGGPLPSRYPTLQVVTFVPMEPGRWTAHLAKSPKVYDIYTDGNDMGVYNRNGKTALQTVQVGDWDFMRLAVLGAAGLMETYRDAFQAEVEGVGHPILN